jgi:hypothetical protein
LAPRHSRSVAIENAKVYKELRRGRIEPSLRFSLESDTHQLIETWDAEKRETTAPSPTRWDSCAGQMARVWPLPLPLN